MEIDPTDIVRFYRGAQRSFAELCATLGEEEWSAPVPCTPGWTVHDVVSHVAGVTDDLARGNVAGATSESWTAAQVERWRDTPRDELLTRWSDQIDEVAAALGAFGEARPPIDCHAHEHDVRHALGRPGDRDTELLAWSADLLARTPAASAVTVVLAGGGELSVAGRDGGAPVELAGLTRFELVRSRLGRRSRAQVAGYAWSVPPSPAVIDGWFLFGPSAVDVLE